MDFTLTEEQQMLRDRVAEMALLELSPRAEEVDRTGFFPLDGLRILSEAELMGILIPSQYGGAGSDLLSFVIATEEIARQCANNALIFATHVAATQSILLGGKEPLKERLLPPLAQGKNLAAYAATEANCGANVLSIETTAQDKGDHYLVKGSKTFITSGGEAHVYVTVARTSPTPGAAGLSLLAIEKDHPGIDYGMKYLRMGMNGTSSSEVLFNNCQVPKENLLGGEGSYPTLGMAIIGIGMLGASAIALGLAEASLEMSLRHAQSRKIGTQPLGNFQGVQYLVSEMSVEVEAMRNILYWAAQVQASTPAGPPIAAFKAKLFTTEAALRVTDKALQLHGSTGYSKDLPLERYYRDARGLTLHFSPTEILKETLGKALLGF